MTVDDEAACRALYDELVAGRNEGSGARFAAAFAEDGELVAFDGSRLQGRATIEAFHQELFDKWMKGTRLTGGVDEVKVLGPDVAVMHAIGGTIKRGKTKPSRARDSIQTLTLKRTDEGWRIAAFQNTRIHPIGSGFLAFLHWSIGDALWSLFRLSTDPTAHVRTSTPQPVASR
ncbi:MAG: SgcJ/EcaC family oxidoreductase [Thermoanaerobacterales bacterium]|jgi:uncharacterized protein (TIGR02246 family)|nr:SgcJ/EcaC family oxidoreductase [Thermoanaerobacterales bacterium]